MNKVGLSLSILSLCWFISTTGWSGGLVSNSSFSSSKAILANTSTQEQQSVAEKDQQSVKNFFAPDPEDLRDAPQAAAVLWRSDPQARKLAPIHRSGIPT